ncbi:MAG: hypothetical protein WDO68_06185 [Gammaproteobacteria bacterium]
MKAARAAAIPKAAELYEAQISRGLEGNPDAATEARLILQDLFPEKIRLISKEDGSLWASGAYQTAALLKVAGTRGRDDRI